MIDRNPLPQYVHGGKRSVSGWRSNGDGAKSAEIQKRKAEMRGKKLVPRATAGRRAVSPTRPIPIPTPKNKNLKRKNPPTSPEEEEYNPKRRK